MPCRAETIPWILLLYSLPTPMNSERVGLWRKLKRLGAYPFKTSAYLLPNRPELVERFQWLAQQANDAGGEGRVLFVAELDGLGDDAMVALFNRARAEDYVPIVAGLERVLSSDAVREDPEKAIEEIERARKRYREIRRIDYFDSPRGREVGELLERVAEQPHRPDAGTVLLDRRGYRGRTWLTRPRPAIDRVGSAWLIRRRIDPDARFVFADTMDAHPGAVGFDMTGGEFTHRGDDCTFETLVKAFGLTEPALNRLAEAIHDADLDDGRFQADEAIGLDRVFKGWAELGVCDEEILDAGFRCFDALHAFLRSETSGTSRP